MMGPNMAMGNMNMMYFQQPGFQNPNPAGFNAFGGGMAGGSFVNPQMAQRQQFNAFTTPFNNAMNPSTPFDQFK